MYRQSFCAGTREHSYWIGCLFIYMLLHLFLCLWCGCVLSASRSEQLLKWQISDLCRALSDKRSAEGEAERAAAEPSPLCRTAAAAPSN